MGRRNKRKKLRQQVRRRTSITKLYLDDIRNPPEGWTLTRDPHAVLPMLLKHDVEHLSLDHDLSMFTFWPDNWQHYFLGGDEVDISDEVTGYDVLCQIEQALATGVLPLEKLPKIYIHTDNPAGRKRMELTLMSIERIANELSKGRMTEAVVV